MLLPLKIYHQFILCRPNGLSIQKARPSFVDQGLLKVFEISVTAVDLMCPE